MEGSDEKQEGLAEIGRETLRYTRTGLWIQILGLVVMVLGLISTGIIPNIYTLLVVLVFLSIIFIGILLSSPSTEKGQSIDWDRALISLENLRRKMEKLKGWTANKKSHKTFDRLYYSFLRRLYYHAVLEGRKKFAEELWKKGQLSKKE